MRILIDMNLSPEWESFLREAGIEAIHWSAIGPVTTPDPAIMAFASEHGYGVLTRDLGFGTALAMARAVRPSVILLRGVRARPEDFGSRVLAALRQLGTSFDEGALLTIQEKKVRMRLLPLDSEIDAS